MNQVEDKLSVVHVPIDDLRPDPANPRRISDAELESLTRSIRRFGFVDPVIARREDKSVIGGHQRLLAARRLGLASVPVVLVDLPAEQARLLNLALNRISGSWDEELLARLLSELDAAPEVDLSLSGFDDDEVAKLLKSLDARDKRERIEHFDPDAALNAAQANPLAQPGDVWKLGDHRLLCGDSTDVRAVGRLFGEKRASLMATDPPYLVDYSGGNHPASKSNRGDPNRDKHWDDYHDPESSVDFYFKFLSAGLAHLVSHSPIYQWHAHRRQALVEEAWTQGGPAGPPADHLGQGPGRPHSLVLPLAARALLRRLGPGQHAETQASQQRLHHLERRPALRADGRTPHPETGRALHPPNRVPHRAGRDRL